jgi:hypothetical protein
LDRGHHIEELRQRVQLERQLIARSKTANIRFTDAQVERIWAIVSAHQAGLSIRKIAGATGLSSSRIHQLLNAPEAKRTKAAVLLLAATSALVVLSQCAAACV